MSESSDEDNTSTPMELEQKVVNAECRFLPRKTREKYLKAYNVFNEWRNKKKANTFSESVLLTYFTELSQTKQSPTMWSIYSMLKSTIKTKHDVHIESYAKLISFLKRKSVGHKSKKSRVFTAHNIETFLNEAPDCYFLAAKVILIIGISGAFRSNELLNLTVNDIEKHSDKLLLINQKNTKTNVDRSFVIRENYVNFVEKYIMLRPKHIKTNRFFIQYRNNKCSIQPMGKNKICAIPREIAAFLKLEEPQLYTGHCFRRTSATLLTDSGADLSTLKRHDGMSNPVAEVYIEDPIEKKPDIHIVETITLEKTSDHWSDPCASTSKEEHDAESSRSESPTPTFTQTDSDTYNLADSRSEINKTITLPNKTVTFNLTNCSNFTFNF